MAFVLLPEAEADLDGIWLYVARHSSMDTANRLMDTLTERFWLLARIPRSGAHEITICDPACAAFLWASMSFSTALTTTTF
jgi:plasmid stabilization system protein ParE